MDPGRGDRMSTRRWLFLTLIACLAIMVIPLTAQHWVKVHHCKNETPVCWGGQPPAKN
jgi:hypothetical protein